MNTKSIILRLVIFNVFFSWPALAQDPDWLRKMKRIELLSQSYEDVVRILGEPIDGTRQKELSEYFDLRGGRLWVGFASGTCTPSGGWKVPEWTVTNLSFRPSRPLHAKKLRLDISLFERSVVDDVPGAAIYRNETLGIKVSVNAKGRIEEIEFFPSSKFRHLHCSYGLD